MAFQFVTGSGWFKKMNQSLDGKIIIEKWKRRVFTVVSLLINDVQWQNIQYKKTYGKKLMLENPVTMPEKILYLKLFYQNPLLHVCVDKYFVRDYINMKGYGNILIPEIAIYNHAFEINFDDLPDKFVLKCTQGSGGNLIVDKKSPSYAPQKIKKYFAELLKNDYYKVSREFGYKGLKPRILCQQFLNNGNDSPLADYKFYCFNGELRYYMLSYGEYNHDVRNHKFDANNESIDYIFKKTPTLERAEVSLPSNIEEMKSIAEELSKPFPHVRVDLFNIDGKIYFGELTFYSNGGFIQIHNKEAERDMGKWIPLKKYKDDMVFNKHTLRYKSAIVDTKC